MPDALLAMIRDEDPARRGRAMQAFMPMTKLEIAVIRQAFDGP